MKIAILGYGIEGKAAYAYWREGNDITICDRKTQLIRPPEGVEMHLGEAYLEGLEGFDLVVRSPQIHPRHLQYLSRDKITSNINEFLRVCPTQNIIGITGTKGKGTTSTLTAKMLEAAGKTVHLGGNIGIAPLQLLDENIQPSDYVVLELSNFQLIDLKQSPPLAVCLMVVPEHMDWHEDFEEYVAAKQQLFIHQTENDRAIYFAGNETSISIADASVGTLIPYYEAPGAYVENDRIVIDGQEICHTSELKLLGAHNWQNACAAVTTAWQITQDVDALRSVLTSFSGLPYRLELVRELDGVRYYNDSFGTTPETAIVALEAFAEPKVIILGGSDKGASYDELAAAVKANNVRQVILIGDQADRIQASLERVDFHDFTPGGDSMTDIAHAAMAAAESGDVVLLSTGCASFGMFKNYKDRGAQFMQAVLALAATA